MSRENQKNWDLRTLLSVIGFIFELVRVVVHALEKRSGTVEHLRRLIKEPKLVDQVFDLIVGKSMLKFNPAEFIGKGWHIDPSDEQLPAAPADIDLVGIVFKNMFRDGETVLNGEERIRRLREAGSLCLTADHFLRFWNERDKLPESLKRTDNGEIRYILFDGTILRSPSGDRCVLYLCWRVGAWRWDCGRLGVVWDAQDQSAVAGK